jgi:acetoacetyl-CoA synthetase
VEEQKVTKLGLSPRWMFELAKNAISPREIADMSSLRIVTCTGMVLSDQLFEWFYDKGFPKNVHLANISGGTDIVSSDQATYIVVGIVLTPWLRLVVSVS